MHGLQTNEEKTDCVGANAPSPEIWTIFFIRGDDTQKKKKKKKNAGLKIGIKTREMNASQNYSIRLALDQA